MDAGKKRKRSASTRSRKRKNVTEEDETVAIVPEEPVEDDTAILPAAKKVRKRVLLPDIACKLTSFCSL